MKESTERAHTMKVIFAQHPEANEFHVTSDNQAFTLQNDADNHAKDLADKSVALCKRADFTDTKEKAVKPADEGDKEKEAAKAARKSLTDEYKSLYGKGVSPSWDNNKITEMIAAKKAGS